MQMRVEPRIAPLNQTLKTADTNPHTNTNSLTYSLNLPHTPTFLYMSYGLIPLRQPSVVLLPLQPHAAQGLGLYHLVVVTRKLATQLFLLEVLQEHLQEIIYPLNLRFNFESKTPREF